MLLHFYMHLHPTLTCETPPQIQEIRDGHAAKTTMATKLDKCREEIAALKLRVRAFDEVCRGGVQIFHEAIAKRNSLRLSIF